MEKLDLWEIERELHAEGIGLICGVDEAGRGPLAGPVCAAAVILPPEAELPGLNDSKKLSEKKREQLFPEIQRIALAWHVAFASGEEIEELLKRGGCPSSMEEIHLPESLAEDSLTLSPYVRNRLSFNRLRKMIVTE